MDPVFSPLPDNLSEIVGAIVTIVSAIILAFKRGRVVGHNRAIEGKD